MTKIHLIKKRYLRANMTAAERTLWSKIRQRQLGNARFRRQHAIGPFIVDFACVELKLAIEIDGGQHDEKSKQDVDRSRFLERQGWRVIRFWNHEILLNISGVIDVISASLVPPP